MNKKYKITDIAHPRYPWLHRIRAKEDIGDSVKSGDLGGYIESQSNLSFESGDDAWLFGGSVCCGDAYICKNAVLRDNAVAKDRAYVSHGASLSGSSIAEDDAIVRGALMAENARVSGSGMLIQSPDTGCCPEAIGRAAVYGKVIGDFLLAGDTVVVPGEEFHNDSKDLIWLYDNKRTVQRGTSRDVLTPTRTHPKSHDRSR